MSHRESCIFVEIITRNWIGRQDYFFLQTQTDFDHIIWYYYNDYSWYEKRYFIFIPDRGEIKFAHTQKYSRLKRRGKKQKLLAAFDRPNNCGNDKAKRIAGAATDAGVDIIESRVACTRKLGPVNYLGGGLSHICHPESTVSVTLVRADHRVAGTAA